MVSCSQGLAKAQETLQAQWEAQSAEATRHHDQLVADVTRDYERRLEVESQRFEALSTQKAAAEQELREMQRLGEENADAEIEELRTRCDSLPKPCIFQSNFLQNNRLCQA